MVTKCNLVPGSLEVCTKFFPAVKRKQGGRERKREDNVNFGTGV